MEFSKKQPTDADRFLQRMTDTHTSSSIFSQANFNTEDMTPKRAGCFEGKDQRRTENSADQSHPASTSK